jgi:hypothetical protein
MRKPEREKKREVEKEQVCPRRVMGYCTQGEAGI